MNNHWATPYIGLPYAVGGRGPREFDCWGLVREIYRNEFGIELPEYPGIWEKSPHEIITTIQEGLQRDWMKVIAPFDGCLVAMSQQTHIHHVGLYTAADGGKIIHSFRGLKVVAEKERHLRVRGFRVFQYYRHLTWPTSSKLQTRWNHSPISESTSIREGSAFGSGSQRRIPDSPSSRRPRSA